LLAASDAGNPWTLPPPPSLTS